MKLKILLRVNAKEVMRMYITLDQLMLIFTFIIALVDLVVKFVKSNSKKK